MNMIIDKLRELKAMLMLKSDCSLEVILLDNILKDLWNGKDGDYLVVPKYKITNGFHFEPDQPVIGEIWKRTLVCTIKTQYEGIDEVLKTKALSEEMNEQLEKELINYLGSDK